MAIADWTRSGERRVVECGDGEFMGVFDGGEEG